MALRRCTTRGRGVDGRRTRDSKSGFLLWDPGPRRSRRPANVRSGDPPRPGCRRREGERWRADRGVGRSPARLYSRERRWDRGSSSLLRSRPVLESPTSGGADPPLPPHRRDTPSGPNRTVPTDLSPDPMNRSASGRPSSCRAPSGEADRRDVADSLSAPARSGAASFTPLRRSQEY